MTTHMDVDEAAYIEKAAEKIVETDLEAFAVFFLTSFKPLANIAGELSIFFGAPFLLLLENKGFEFIETFQKTNNIERLVSKIEKLSKQKEIKQKEEKQKSSNNGIGFFDRIKKYFIR